jgi:hypothetical protein
MLGVSDGELKAEPAEPGPKSAAVREKRCKCGYGRGHEMVSATGDYTFGGWCLVLFGISARPRAIKFHCRRCDQDFDRATDEKTIAETRLWG